MQDLIPKDQHIPPQSFHRFCNGRNRILDRLCDLFIDASQFPQQRIVCLDLSLHFTPVSDEALLFHSSCSHTFMDGRLFQDTPIRMATVVDPCIGTDALQIAVGHICPGRPPQHQLLIGVPPGGDGILPPKPGTFGCLGYTLEPCRFCRRRGHIFLFSANLVLVLLLPAFLLGLLEFCAGEAHFIAIPDAQIFFFRFVLPLSVFSQRPHRYHDVGMGVMPIRVVNTHIGAHPICNKIVLDEFRQQILPCRLVHLDRQGYHKLPC